jgi:hypothetical protein
MYKSFKWALLILANVAMARVGGLLALLITGTNFSVSSGVGFLALFGVSVQTGVIMLEYINQLRARGRSIEDAAVEGAVLRLRPIMMTMLPRRLLSIRSQVDGHQFSLGFVMWSTTRLGTGSCTASSLSPICSCTAVKIEASPQDRSRTNRARTEACNCTCR